jgi:hypothetical protein
MHAAIEVITFLSFKLCISGRSAACRRCGALLLIAALLSHARASLFVEVSLGWSVSSVHQEREHVSAQLNSEHQIVEIVEIERHTRTDARPARPSHRQRHPLQAVTNRVPDNIAHSEPEPVGQSPTASPTASHTLSPSQSPTAPTHTDC